MPLLEDLKIKWSEHEVNRLQRRDERRLDRGDRIDQRRADRAQSRDESRQRREERLAERGLRKAARQQEVADAGGRMKYHGVTGFDGPRKGHAVLISLFLMFIGYILSNYLPEQLGWLLVFGLSIAIFVIMYRARRTGEGLILVFLFMFLFWFFIATPYGQQLSFQFAKADPFNELQEEAEDTGITHQFNVLGEILSGDFNPDELWQSSLVESEYAVPEEFNLVIADVEPRKESFKSNETISIGGRINLVSGFDQTTKIELGAEPNTVCSKNYEDQKKDFQRDIDDWLGNAPSGIVGWDVSQDYQGCSYGNWTCYISGSDVENVFNMDRIYNRQFYCDHLGVQVDEKEVVPDLKVTWEYTTAAVAGMQIYAFNPDIVDRTKEPLKRYNISEDSRKSWYIGDKNLNLGLDLGGGGRDFVRADIGASDSFSETNYLGISIYNKGTGEVTEVESLSVSFPSTEMVEVANQIRQTEVPDYDLIFEGPTTEVITVLSRDVVTKKFTLSGTELAVFQTLKPTEHTAYYIPFVVLEEYVGESAFQSFLVKVELKYKYKDSESTTAIVKPIYSVVTE
ncbi:hypothetical protein HOD83_02100 [Candidatus Woesearchaeota archaeon]|jgi:hypothetical protein|nr:hypothetical protein [Candidatus Woesearchaeota archaeon]MBT4248358.1 hypothetical protein [Candidatus Woesearchaeota archaeon]